MTEQLLRIRAANLSCGRSGQPVLAGIALDVGAGEGLAVIGPNGSGKTTLLRTLAGLNPALGGQLTIPGQGLAYLGHRNGIKGRLTVAENIRHWAMLYGKQLPSGLIEAFGLSDLAATEAGMLSQGRQRLTALACTAATGSRIWMIDEPAASLDDVNAQIFSQVLDRHCEGGGMAVIATHREFPTAGMQVLDVANFRSGSLGPC